MSDTSWIAVVKGDDGLRTVLLFTSNAYEDRDEEIVSQKALERHVKNFEPGGKLLFWHGGQPIGTVVAAEMIGPFLVEVGKELPNKVIDLALPGEDPFLVERKDVWDMMQKHKGIWGVSPGFVADKDDARDGIFEFIHIRERSILLRKNAANLLTFAAF